MKSRSTWRIIVIGYTYHVVRNSLTRTSARNEYSKELTPSVAAIRDRLRRELDDAFKASEAKLFAEIEGGHEKEANTDPPRFVAKYFLDAQGQPDKEKTKEALAFASRSHEKELDDVVQRVPGLAIRRTRHNTLVGWEHTMQQGIENEFDRLESLYWGKKEKIHSAQADVDWELFLQRYLAIDIDGSAVDPKPSAPVILERWCVQTPQLAKDITARAAGLHMRESKEFSVIGWDASKVDTEVARLEDIRRRASEHREAENKARRAKEEVEKKERWERRCKGHYELVANQQQQPSPFGLQSLRGSYLVQWHRDRDCNNYNNPRYEDEVMKINIFPPKSPHGVNASFFLGLIEGTMLLGMSKRDVTRLREKQPKRYSKPEEDSDDDGYQGGIHFGEGNENVMPLEQAGEKRPLEDIADPYGAQASRAKRLKTEENASGPKQQQAHSNRVYFQFACNEVRWHPIVDDGNRQVGHLDFDESGLTAKGVFYLPDHFGKEAQSISLFNLAETPESGKEPEPWCWYG